MVTAWKLFRIVVENQKSGEHYLNTQIMNTWFSMAWDLRCDKIKNIFG